MRKPAVPFRCRMCNADFDGYYCNRCDTAYYFGTADRVRKPVEVTAVVAESAGRRPAGATVRPLNRCASCRSTWYPRGSDRSAKCPRCGGPEVEVLYPG